MQFDPLELLGDLSVGLSGILPFITIMLLGRRFEALTRVKSYWWFFVVGILGFDGYLAVYWFQRLDIMDFGSSLLAYVVSALLLMGAADTLGTIFFMRLTGSVPTRLLGIFILVGLIVPIMVDMFHAYLSHEHIVSHPMPEVILIQGFMAWLLIAYSYFLIGRIATFFSARNQIFASIAGFLYIGVGFMLLYTVGGFLYRQISFSEQVLLRGISTSIGALGGLLAFISSIRIPSATRSRLSSPIKMDTVVTGIEELDKALGGGLTCPTSIVVMGEAGSGKTTFILRLISRRLAEGDGVLYLCVNNTPESIRMSMRLMGFEPKPYEEKDRLGFVDAYSSRGGVKSEERYTSVFQFSEMNITLSKVLEQLKGERRWVAIDSITTILHEFELDNGLIFLRAVVAKLRLSQVSLITGYNQMALPPAASALVQEAVDGTVELKIKETNRGIIRIMLVPRLRNTRPLPVWTEIKY